MANRGKPDVSIRHTTEFDANLVHANLEEKFDTFKAHGDMLKALAKIKVDNKKASLFLSKIFDGQATPSYSEGKEVVLSRPAANVLRLFNGEGLGSELESSKGTAYGLLNAVTQHYDWSYGKTQDSRIESAWFGDNAQLKQRFAEQLMEAVAA